MTRELNEVGHRVQWNAAANYANAFWRIVAVYVFVPHYVRILGISAYGLIAWYATAMAILFLFEGGMSSAFSREVAKSSGRTDLLVLLRSIEGVLYTALISVGIIIFLSASSISEEWLARGNTLSPEITKQCIQLMPLGLVPQIVVSLYHGGLMGQQRQILANGINAALTTARSGVVLIPLIIWPDPRVFFAWQAICSWIFLFIFRGILIGSIERTARDIRYFSLSALSPIMGYASGVFLLTVINSVGSQLDRLIVSRLQSLGDFGYYALAATVAFVPQMLAAPIGAAILPKFTELLEKKNTNSVDQLFENSTYIVSAITGGAAAVIVVFAPELMQLWLGGKAISSEMHVVIVMLGLGSLVLAQQTLPIQLSLANGHTTTPVLCGILTLMCAGPAMIISTMRYGMIGAAAVMAISATVSTLSNLMLLSNRFYRGNYLRWLWRLILLPIATSLLIMLTIRSLSSALGSSSLTTLGIAFAGWLVCSALLYLHRPGSRV